MKPFRVLCTLFVTLGLFLTPTLAFGDEATSASTPQAGPNGTLTTITTYLSTEQAPDVPEAITHEGEDYTLEGATTAPSKDYAPPVKRLAASAFREIPLEGINNLGSYFPATMYAEEGEFRGDIGLDAAVPYTVAEHYEMFSNQVDRVAVFEGLPDNDAVRIPTSYVFEVRSVAGPGVTELKQLTLLDVSFTVSGTDHLGLPNNYTARATYRGEEYYLELHHYDVTANYAGDIASPVTQLETVATYSKVEVIAPANEAPLIRTAEVPLAGLESESSFFPLAIAGTTVAVFLALPLIYLFFLCNARLIRVADEEGKATKRLICRRRLVLREGVTDFHIPSNTDILDGGQYHLAIKPLFASREGEVRLIWQGRVMAVLPLDTHATINFREMLIVSAESALMEMDGLH